ncbi:DUF1444 domain-containing protein [Halalkalibacterium halodurans]|uniref:DUF1444 domain-containing protein n=1 Tax=Halalkalibacterium halodurans TaxID=86665 RepID=UPI00106818FC|nr:DUF1444 domain-containing protein [Halalkalibacterium halodurans]TES54362.1 DUF1444 domain-containing protein [Halalkalibacterium halodurans]
MEVREIRKQLEEKLNRPEWTLSYDHKEAKLRIEDKELKKGMTIALKPLLAKVERLGDRAISEMVHYVQTGMAAFKKQTTIKGNEKRIFPVIRATSFPEENRDGHRLLFDEHTAETRVYYSLDLGDSYTILHEQQLSREEMSAKEIREMALFNLRSLSEPLKADKVAGNTFYFLNSNDGYDASRILNEPLLEKMSQKVEGQLAVAAPHQDVLIFADIVNERGYDVLAQVTMQFYAQGRIPITALPFLYENGELEPTFILAQRKPKE